MATFNDYIIKGEEIWVLGLTTKDFEEIYKNTYKQTLKFIIVKCNNIDDINDIIQDTYIELLKIIKKKQPLEIDNLNSYILGIANNIIKRHYYKKKKENIVYYYSKYENDIELEIKDDFDLEQDIITKENVSQVWEYLKNKNIEVTKIFYLYFALGLKISDISKELEMTESNVKNKIYRTLKELKKYIQKGCEKYD
ncbi:MAG: sigma-70 family RNA polymerase sigma factor [Clostridia bacterium]|nr:sigma-70 family RNA polymerase sigma factor [Clostridia bacterium]